MNKKLIEKALKLRDEGFATAGIADELNISVDTALYLILNGERLLTESEEKIETEEKNIDIYVEWDTIKMSSKRLKNIALIMADMVKDVEFDGIVGISSGGVPLATLMSEHMDKTFSIYTPKKHLHGTKKSSNLEKTCSIMNTGEFVIVDDVLTSGKTMAETIKAIRCCGAPKKAIVIIDKSGLKEIEGVPVEALFRVGTVEVSKSE